ncbi:MULTISPECIES: FAD-dependent oxidoreductase [unclassified Agrobacterium]|uniref:NAD(P)/FAD-dependent oxidoreductase n=1 Tax=unclassified Agrobacterium TaxID=2632611 RepID=UPI00244C721E|nr:MULTISPECIES: FAD-dependent oxidoreductase [unclassified Agrobacterium]MDH0612147.1 NAD(P)/FAD-dependent oxidoreductase [Agrobacterium sp. GD03872]MDH0696044.1 NAD(P)/FAD-dependent oxidoreductase [Agrobacterium sp. GD03871]MDH1058682.1 NAD(P)/FAD-dependent oxidoreductase [Agrobacterium sp. GD03992]MDH2210773.1 NAD(P)/FAD-dependent oxidoreductase [Agrobacterium sp. GD03643]MDH2217811.1 NAD(P)/FAD-dependent oxidoreductase [Agrobacterium sp. GD03638]
MSQPDVIIIGGGPSGVAAAISMRKAGIEKVTLLEREQHLGGATRHCSHSPFGMLEFGRVYLGAAYGRRLEREVQTFGIDVRYGHSVARLGEDGELLVANFDGLQTIAARRVLVTTGVRETTRAARLVSGDRPVGVLTTGTLQSYVAFHNMMPFKRPVIVGSELVTLSAVWTCLSHGARPVAVVEPRKQALVRVPLAWFPSLMGIPFHRSAEIVDILGRGRVEAVVVKRGETVETLECDGVLFSGGFIPESSLFMTSGLAVDWGSTGPAVDQHGRCENPHYFAAGNVLRAVETGGWAFREGRAVGEALAADMLRPVSAEAPVKVTFDAPIKLVVPNLIRSGADLPGGLRDFQLRFQERVTGTLALCIDGRPVWQKRGLWRPESRTMVPRPDAVRHAQHVHFSFREEG